MIDLGKDYLSGTIFINYDEGLKGCVLLENKNGIVPVELKDKDLKFITFYPNIMQQLMNGKKIYFKDFTGYLGREEFEGPYGEQTVFISEYESVNTIFSELMINLENKIKNKKTNVRKLSKLGGYYK